MISRLRRKVQKLENADSDADSRRRSVHKLERTENNANGGVLGKWQMIAVDGRSRSVPVRADLGCGLDESTPATGDRVFARGEQSAA